MTDTDSVSNSPAPSVEQPSSSPHLARIIAQLDTIINLLQNPIREKAQRQQEEERTASSFGKALRDYAQGDPE
jgi:hypothetical protein